MIRSDQDNISETNKNKYKMKNLDPALEMKIQDIKDLIYRCLIQPAGSK